MDVAAVCTSVINAVSIDVTVVTEPDVVAALGGITDVGATVVDVSVAGVAAVVDVAAVDTAVINVVFVEVAFVLLPDVEAAVVNGDVRAGVWAVPDAGTIDPLVH